MGVSTQHVLLGLLARGPRHGYELKRAHDERLPRARPLDRRLAVDQDSVERGLASLVLTVIELLRQLMERQALRRVDLGDLTEEQVERVGATLMALEEQMTQLREYFGLAPEDLNLDLGPLGPLLPTD
ncbi:hypothetical protein GCM10027452_40610 [Micromonospora halotolerans]